MVTRESLADRFLTEKGRIAVGTLGGGLVGGGLYALLQGIVGIVLGGGRALDILLGGYARALRSNVTALIAGLEAEVADAWDPFQAGVFSLPLNVLVVIVGFAVAALAVRWYVG
ncbi:hypothetical protein [Halobaculum rubrum]|uniref:hypothetical protein n=1 Tax=Halobaculum rubrum TaxID=2872158 RepID=UPI001CA39ED9|nr:hypothetical protein [Halobaculum rubrum]QZX98727.1 hypothetical protein K6T25_10625 [Halobaculum rubrum]